MCEVCVCEVLGRKTGWLKRGGAYLAPSPAGRRRGSESNHRQTSSERACPYSTCARLSKIAPSLNSLVETDPSVAFHNIMASSTDRCAALAGSEP